MVVEPTLISVYSCNSINADRPQTIHHNLAPPTDLLSTNLLSMTLKKIEKHYKPKANCTAILFISLAPKYPKHVESSYNIRRLD